MDTVTTETRSRVMRAVASRHNRSTERRLRGSLIGAGITGWKMHITSLPGTPDFVFSAAKLAVFVDGCFWHGCPKCYRRPSSSTEYWDAKVQRNRVRDRDSVASIRDLGWRVLRIWEHDLRDLPSVRKQIIDCLDAFGKLSC